MSAYVLIVDDEENLTYFLKDALGQRDYVVDAVHTVADANTSIQSKFPDLLLLDLNLPDGNGLDVYRKIKEIGLGIPTIIITAHASVKSAIEAMKLGVDDYIIKPFELDELIVTIEEQLKRFQLNNRFNYYRQQLQESYQDEFFISNLPIMKEIQDLSLKIAQVEESVILIEGPSGTGKEMLARFIHQNSPQSDAPFVEINCASLPENLLESELFGYEPGAFTDAKKRKIGLIELSAGGTLFLDEISEMTPALQAKLLRVIENRVFKRLGGVRDIKVNIRIIASTNRDIRAYVEEKQFRQDLFFRLNMFHLKLPPLSERKEEVLLIAQFFLQKIAKKLLRKVKYISDDAQKMVLKYAWPGNIRELHNTIERAVILCEGDTIDLKHLACEMMQEKEGKAVSSNATLDDLDDSSLREHIDSVERSLLTQALQMSKGNQLQAAKLLGEPRHIIRYLIKKHNLSL
ncbi:MAG: sigma-54 dependent transcriptional regulator [candidate division KSB1 bacterium]|jgi:DNA-binding NtrC family response regulator|nr:sigma-54 dependent transcriptional regulator [candidate division KSB1 bacterium]